MGLFGRLLGLIARLRGGTQRASLGDKAGLVHIVAIYLIKKFHYFMSFLYRDIGRVHLAITVIALDVVITS